MVVGNLIASHTLGQPATELPYTLTVVSDGRQLDVSGQAITFTVYADEGHAHSLSRTELPG
jgi:hypothetical protein